MNKRVFTYWVNMPGHSMPGYIELCVETWRKHIPNLELVTLDHDNLREWVGDIDFMRFLRLSLPMQSDVVSFMILAQHGGVFMDADTIVTKDIFEEIGKIGPGRFAAFGYPGTTNIHMAILMASEPGNEFATVAASLSALRLSKLPIIGSFDMSWDQFGNRIITEVSQIEHLKDLLYVLDRTGTGNILESIPSLNLSYLDDGGKYNRFYFNIQPSRQPEILDLILPQIKFGAVSLHNSWTPEHFKNLSREQVLDTDTMLAALLRHALA